MKRSFAQNFEDIYLNRLFKEKKTGFYVDVGAHHSKNDSVTKLFYDRGWSGINIEPIQESFEEIARNRPRDITIRSAIADYSGKGTITNFIDTGLSTLHQDYIKMHIKELDHKFNEEEVEITTLDKVFLDYGVKNIDFLKIDVEGFEDRVLYGLNLTKFRPVVIVFEDTVPTRSEKIENQKLYKYLIKNRYEKVFFDGLNSYFLSEENLHLSHNFDIPVNVFDFEEFSLDVKNDMERSKNIFIKKYSISLSKKSDEISELNSSIDFLNNQNLKTQKFLFDVNTANQNLNNLVNNLNQNVLIRDNLLQQQENLINALNARLNKKLYKFIHSLRKISRAPRKILQFLKKISPTKTNLKNLIEFFKLSSFARYLISLYKEKIQRRSEIDNFGEDDFVYTYDLSMPADKIKYAHLLYLKVMPNQFLVDIPFDKNYYTHLLEKS